MIQKDGRSTVSMRRREAVIALSAVTVVVALGLLSLTRALRTAERPPSVTHVTPTPSQAMSTSPSAATRTRAIERIEHLPPLLEHERSVVRGPFAQAAGWIAFRSGGQLVAVDPSEPGRSTVLGPARGRDPIAWSPDGARLLLLSRPERWYPRLSVMSADGSVVNVTPRIPGPPREPIAGVWGSFSPDGRAIVYGCCGSSRGPYIIDLYGGSLRVLGDPCGSYVVKGRSYEMCGEPADEAAAWSPDGSRIAWFDFAEGTIFGVGHVNVLSFVRTDGTHLREGVAQLPGSFGGSQLVWSPDGSRLAFWYDEEEDGRGDVFVIDLDRRRVRQITHGGDNRWPAWSPDGSRIAFVRNGVLRTMAPDGSDMETFEGVAADGAIAWNQVG